MKRSARRFCFWVWRARRASSRSERSPCGIACRSGKAKLLLIAHDAGDHTFRRARSYCRAGKHPYLCVPFTKDELGDALGCNACALCAILDAPFAKAFLEDLPELAQQHEDDFTGADAADRARAETPPGRKGTPEKREIW